MKFSEIFPSCIMKKIKFQTSPQNEKLNDLIIALQLRVGGVENYCPNNTGQDWQH